MKKKMMSLVLAAAMIAGMTVSAVPAFAEDTETPDNEITGDSSADDAFVIWGWKDDIKKILDGPMLDDTSMEGKWIIRVCLHLFWRWQERLHLLPPERWWERREEWMFSGSAFSVW